MWGRAPSPTVSELWKRVECKAGYSQLLSNMRPRSRYHQGLEQTLKSSSELLTSIHLFSTAFASRGRGGDGACLSCLGGYAPDKTLDNGTTNIQRHTSIHTHSSGHFRVTDSPLPQKHVFGLREEDGGSGENPLRYRENMQTPLAPTGFEPSCCVIQQ